MEYDIAAYRADLATMADPSEDPPTPTLLSMKRKKLALDLTLDQAAIDAAYGRLGAFAAKLMQAAMKPPPETPAPAALAAPVAVSPKAARKAARAEPGQAQAILAAKREWAAELAARQVRHDRRRKGYPKLKPLLERSLKSV